jgi:threonine-phosphate decarboxylase
MSRIEKYGHGGDLVTASAVFGVSEDQWLDFSANINPLGPPDGVKEVLKNGEKYILHYPDPAHRKLRQALADKLCISPEEIMVGNGAAECMALIFQAFRPGKTGVVQPCFVEYTQLAALYGSTLVTVYGKEERGFKPDLAEVHQLIKSTDLVILGHPNNPTGLVYTYEELVQLAQWAEEENALLVFDEAFLDFLPEMGPTLMPARKSYPHVLFLRSMTKFYAIPGLRLGYAIGDKEKIAAMKNMQIPWSVNGLALAAGEACCHVEDYEQATRQLIIKERNYLMEFFQGLQWDVLPGCANYLLVRLPRGKTSREFQFQLARRGILIRDCSMYPGLTERDFRIAVRGREENQLLVRRIREIVKEWGK